VTTHAMQCGSEGAALGVADFALTATRGLAVLLGTSTASGTSTSNVGTVGDVGPAWLEHGASHCLPVGEASSGRDDAMTTRVAEWRAEAGLLLGLDTEHLIYNASTVRDFDRNSHSRMPLVPMPSRLTLLQACDHYHASRVATTSYRCHCKLRPNTEGLQPHRLQP
jgi:hypothetical protein